MNKGKSIIFVSGLFPKEQENEIVEKSKGVIQFAANTFQWSLLEGFINNDVNVKVFNMPFIGSFPKRYEDLRFPNGKFNYKNRLIFNISFCNVAVFKIYSRYIHMKKFILDNCQDEILILYSMNISYIIASIDAKRKNTALKICIVVPDLPEYMSDSRNLLYRFSKNLEIKLIKKYLKKIDYFVLLTESMINSLNISDRPCTIVEGIYHAELGKTDIEKEKGVVFLYTGTLAKRYGIINLIKAFEKLKDENFQLWICGEGDGKEYLLSAMQRDTRIKFFGQLKNSVIRELHYRATVLVNPRQSNEEFTKYSFPSKTIEYLASGTPTVMYRLAGVPENYYDFFYSPKDDSIEALTATLSYVASLSEEERFLFGKRAKEFIVKNKNATIQTKKIIDLFENIKYEN